MDLIWNYEVEAFWFQLFYCRLSLYPSALAPWCHTSPMLGTVQDCKKKFHGLILAIGLLQKLTAVDLAETEQQDKASRAPEA